MSVNESGKKKKEFPNGLLILFSIVVLVAILTYLVPAGEFGTMTVDDKEVIDPNGFHFIESKPASLIDVFLAIPKGFQNAAMLITMILCIGGAISLVDKTGAIEGAIAGAVRKLGETKKELILIFLTTFFACLGAFPAMLEAMIPFAPITVAVALVMGYDLLVGVSMPLFGVVIGWTSGVTNPYTTGIGHNMVGLPMFSGLLFRFIFFMVMLIATNWFIISYARKVQKNPASSVVADIPVDEKLKSVTLDGITFTLRHKLIILTFVATIATIVTGTISFKWDMNKMSAFYIIGAIICGIIAGFSPNKIVESFIDGSTTIFPAAFAVGVARGISVLMTDSKIIDTIVYYLSLPLSKVGPLVSSVLMVIVQTLINFFIPSGSGQAMATLPIMLPLGQIIGLSDQVTILAFQIGDGLSNLIYPTVALTVAYLTYVKVPFSRWIKYLAKYYCCMLGIGMIFTIIGVLIGW